jgi:hypothetical protein
VDRRTNEPPRADTQRRPETEPVTGSSGIVTGSGDKVYLAASLPLLGSDGYLDALEAVGRRFPEATVLDPRDLFRDSAEWLWKWPTVVPCITALVFLASEDRTIGAGVFQEVLDARFHFVPIYYLDRRGAFHAQSKISFRFLGDGDPFRMAAISVRGSG